MFQNWFAYKNKYLAKSLSLDVKLCGRLQYYLNWRCFSSAAELRSLNCTKDRPLETLGIRGVISLSQSSPAMAFALCHTFPLSCLCLCEALALSRWYLYSLLWITPCPIDSHSSVRNTNTFGKLSRCEAKDSNNAWIF